MRRRLRKILLFPAALLMPWSLLVGCTVDGAALFEREGCRSCHRFKGAGGNLGLDLTAVGARRSDDWISRQIRNPVVNNPQSRMPDYPHLSRREIRALVVFLKK